jgi:SEFIR domain.
MKLTQLPGLILERLINMDQKEIIKNPKVFVSYSWTSPEHEEWVLNLSNRLRDGNGVDVVLDKWDLKEGHDVFSFMESMVNSPDIEKVLIICDRGYKEKADNRKGGVGTEAQIITPEIYQNAKQEKFIPIVVDRDQDGNDFRPTYLKTRKYIDLSSEDIFEENLIRLVRTLYGKPEHQKPPLGKAPDWLFEEKISHFKTSYLISQMKDSLNKNPKRLKVLAQNFTDTFSEDLEPFRIIDLTNKDAIDDDIIGIIQKLLPLRDAFITFIEILCEKDEEVSLDPIISSFERLYAFTQPIEGMKNPIYDIQFDHIKFLIQELFIYTFCVLLSYGQYRRLYELLNTQFFLTSLDRTTNSNYIIFRHYILSLDEIRKNRLNLNRTSPVADLLITRATLKKYSKDKICEADLLLYYLSLIYFRKQYTHIWYPSTYIYKAKMEFLIRLISNRHFEKIKAIFGVDSPEGLKKVFSEFCSQRGQGYSGIAGIPSITKFIEIDKIASVN